MRLGERTESCVAPHAPAVVGEIVQSSGLAALFEFLGCVSLGSWMSIVEGKGSGYRRLSEGNDRLIRK